MNLPHHRNKAWMLLNSIIAVAVLFALAVAARCAVEILIWGM